MVLCNRLAVFIIVVLTLSILRFYLIQDEIDIYSPKNLNKKLFVTDRKYRCIYYYLNNDKDVNDYDDKSDKYISKRCKEYSSDILNAKLEKSYNIFYTLVKIIYTNVIIFIIYSLYIL